MREPLRYVGQDGNLSSFSRPSRKFVAGASPHRQAPSINVILYDIADNIQIRSDSTTARICRSSNKQLMRCTEYDRFLLLFVWTSSFIPSSNRKMRAAVVLFLVAAALAQDLKCNYAVADISGKFDSKVTTLPYGEPQIVRITCSGNFSDSGYPIIQTSELGRGFANTDFGTVVSSSTPVNVIVTGSTLGVFFVSVGKRQQSRQDYRLGFIDQPVRPADVNITGNGCSLKAVGTQPNKAVSVTVRYLTHMFGISNIEQTYFYANGIAQGVNIQQPVVNGIRYFPISYTWSVASCQFPGTRQLVGGVFLPENNNINGCY
ncbi:hypothetical protein PROFUN_01407 [Planoprotostelium fungivorum]|uniref:Uncharacterized protein n=1 Tax=Planoprotostelium fungivorum TaxID=1890364 RepID=A0A2P6NT48_9EUKA|nr:hypothetical protein PROFUN_01407 [Planoprotostelium fungivorum]